MRAPAASSELPLCHTLRWALYKCLMSHCCKSSFSFPELYQGAMCNTWQASW